MRNPILLADKFVVDKFQWLCDSVTARGLPAHRIAFQFSILMAVMVIVGGAIFYAHGFATGELPLTVAATSFSIIYLLLNIWLCWDIVLHMYRMAITVESGGVAKAEDRDNLIWDYFRLALLLCAIYLVATVANDVGSYTDLIIHTVLRIGSVFMLICFYLMDVVFKKPTPIRKRQVKEAIS